MLRKKKRNTRKKLLLDDLFTHFKAFAASKNSLEKNKVRKVTKTSAHKNLLRMTPSSRTPVIKPENLGKPSGRNLEKWHEDRTFFFCVFARFVVCSEASDKLFFPYCLRVSTAAFSFICVFWFVFCICCFVAPWSEKKGSRQKTD
jgi:hypothetical protein